MGEKENTTMTIQVWGISTGRPGAPPEEQPRCSFCDRVAGEDRRILVAPGASICQECTESAEAVLMDSRASR